MTTKQVRLRRGTTQQHQNFTGVQGEITVDTDKKTIIVHDGTTVGGTPLATEQFVQNSFVDITQGPVGPQGPAGVTIASATVSSQGRLLVTLTNNTVVDAGNVSGIASATVNGAGQLILTKQDGTTINAGSPIGPQGEQGEVGPQGPPGTTDYEQLVNKPNLAPVATSGSYNDLTDTPSIPSIAGLATESYVNNAVNNLVDAAPSALDTLKELATALGNDSNFSASISTQLGNKANTADLAAVATSGSYTDLINTPTLSSVATTGSYTDLGDVPVGRSVSLVNTATYQCSGEVEELLVNYAGDCVITLPVTAVNGMKIKIRDISGNLGKIKKIQSAQYGVSRPGLSIRIQVAEGSNHKIAGRDYDADYIGVPAPNAGREFVFFNNKWYLENLNSLVEDSWWPTKLGGVEFIDTNQPGSDLGGAGLIPFNKGRSAWDLELGAYSSDHIDRSYFIPGDTYGAPESWSRIWLSNRGAIIGGQMYSGASLTLAGGTLNLKSPLDITTPNGISASNVHVAPSNLWEFGRVTIDSGLSYSDTTRLDFTNSRGGTRWIAVGGSRQGGQYTFSPDTTGIWKSFDGMNFTPVPNPFNETGSSANIVTVAHISTGGSWGTLLAASSSNRYFKSTNGGDTWTEVTTSGIGAPTPGQYYFQRKLFGAGTRFYLLESRNIYQSLDGGLSWTNVVPTEVTLDNQIVLNDMAYNPTSNTIIVVGGRWDPSSFGWKGSYAIRSNLTATNETQWTTIIDSNEGGILSVASTTDYDGVDRWGMVRQKSWNENFHGWGVAAQLWNEGNRFTTAQFSKKLSTVIPEVTDGNKEIPWWESALGRQGGGAGWTNHPTLKWEDPNFWQQEVVKSVMCMDRVGVPLMFVATMEWMGGSSGGSEGGGGESTSVVVSHIYTVPDKTVVNPHEDLTESFVAGAIKTLAVHQSGVNMFVMADGDFALYAAGRSVSADGRNWQTWWSLSGYYDESDPALQGEQYLGLQRAPVYDVIAIDSTDVTQINEAIVGSISAEPSQGTFRIQGKQVGSAVMIDTRDANGVLSYNLACYDNKVYAKNLTLDGGLTSMSNVINLNNLTYANIGLGLKGQYGIYHNPTGTAITVPAGQLVTLATYSESFTTVKYLVSAYSSDGVHSQTSEILISGLTYNINNPNGTVTSITNDGSGAWLAFGIVRNPDNIMQIQIVCAASYSCKVSMLPIMMISPQYS